MKDWQMQEIWDREVAALWEQLNAPDPEADRLMKAASRIKCGLDSIDNGLDWVADAIAVLEGTPMADKLQSFLDSFEDLANDLEEVNHHYERGERE